jgi:glycosyltransferase involved in cell wall biosynthesis
MTQLATRQQQATEPEPAAPKTIAYVMSRFPTLSETFVLYEMLALEELDHRVEIFPLLRVRESLDHPEAERLAKRAHYEPFLSGPILASQLYFLLRRPRAYFGALAVLVRETFGCLNFFVGGLAVFPRVVHAARQMELLGVRHVHCHFANHPAAAGFVVHRLTGISYTFTAHGTDLHRSHRMLRRKVAESALTLTVCEYNRKVILAECGDEFADKVRVARCGVDLNIFRPHAKGPHADGIFEVLCVARFIPVKGHRQLIEACRILADEGVEFVCRLIGDGPIHAEIGRLAARLDLTDRVRFEGWRARDEVASYLAKADVLVAPSAPTKIEREGIPVVLMEAMATGLPVVASDLSGIPELVRHDETGLLVPPGDPAALAAALRRLVEDPELRARLGRAGRETIEDEYDLRRNAAALAVLFAEVAS